MPIFFAALALWLAVTILVLALCQAAARGDRLTEAAARAAVAERRPRSHARRRRRGFPVL